MNNNMDDDVKDILAILQQDVAVEVKKDVKKAIKPIEKTTPSVSNEKKEVKTVAKSPATPKNTFLNTINEPEDKSIYNSKVLIREEIYEIFMSLKRIKKFKSVSTLIDNALEEYIQNHKDDIKKTLYERKNLEIL